jgi:hypothetical protein
LSATVIDYALQKNNAAEGLTSVVVARFGGKSEGVTDDERATTQAQAGGILRETLGRTSPR